jgi:hypothetical protein
MSRRWSGEIQVKRVKPALQVGSEPIVGKQPRHAFDHSAACGIGPSFSYVDRSCRRYYRWPP